MTAVHGYLADVLVAVSGSPASVRAAGRVAPLLGRAHRATLLTVVPPARIDFGSPVEWSDHRAVSQATDDAHRDLAIQTIGAAADVLGMPMVAVVEDGDAAEVICRVAAERGVDLVVLGSAGPCLPGVRSTGRVVIDQAPCPVVVLGN